MKKPKKKEKRCFRIETSYTEKEKDQLKQDYSRTTCRNLIEYIRSKTLGRPLTVIYRNASFDDFIEEAILLRKAMENIRNDQSCMSNMPTRLLQIHEEIKMLITKIVDLCMPK